MMMFGWVYFSVLGLLSGRHLHCGFILVALISIWVKRILALVFSCKFCEISKNTFYTFVGAIFIFPQMSQGVYHERFSVVYAVGPSLSAHL